MKLLKKEITYINEVGETKKGYNLYLVVNGVYVNVKPAFKTDYKLLCSLADNYENNN